MHGGSKDLLELVCLAVVDDGVKNTTCMDGFYELFKKNRVQGASMSPRERERVNSERGFGVVLCESLTAPSRKDVDLVRVRLAGSRRRWLARDR